MPAGKKPSAEREWKIAAIGRAIEQQQLLISKLECSNSSGAEVKFAHAELLRLKKLKRTPGAMRLDVPTSPETDDPGLKLLRDTDGTAWIANALALMDHTQAQINKGHEPQTLDEQYRINREYINRGASQRNLATKPRPKR